MAKGKTVKLVAFALPAKPGQLAVVSGHLAAAGISIDAFNAVDSGGSTQYMVAAGSVAKARKALEPLGVEIRDTEALCVEMPNKPGRLQKVTEKIAKAGVDIRASWATAYTGKAATVILVTSDNGQALASLAKPKAAKKKQKD